MENEEVIVNSTAEANNDPVVTIPYDLFQSFRGKYYIGRTPILTIRSQSNCWGGLLNPHDSGVNLFIDTISVTNTSGSPFCARIWLNNTPFGRIFVSPFVTPANTAADPVRISHGLLSYAQNLRIVPFNGDSLASQFVRPQGTQLNEFGGKLILPPCGSCIFFCYARDGAGGVSSAIQTCEISMQWWEQDV